MTDRIRSPTSNNAAGVVIGSADGEDAHELGGDGGLRWADLEPILPDFSQWIAAPFAELRNVNEKLAAAVADRMRTLHYWGQFTDKLPAPYGADGGHQYVHCASEREARAKLAELISTVKQALPTVEITEGEEQTHFLLPGDEEDAEMYAELSPKSEYDASWQANEEADAWFHSYGKTARALFWEIQGGGVADVGVNAEGTEVVLVRSWVDEERREEVRKLSPSEKEKAVRGELAIPSGRPHRDLVADRAVPARRDRRPEALVEPARAASRPSSIRRSVASARSSASSGKWSVAAPMTTSPMRTAKTRRRR